MSPTKPTPVERELWEVKVTGAPGPFTSCMHRKEEAEALAKYCRARGQKAVLRRYVEAPKG